MQSSEFDGVSIESVHFIGVGGVGMSGIAYIAKCLGMKVTGSDLKVSKYTKNLVNQGIEVFVGQDASNIKRSKPDIVVVSSAIPEFNPELVEAKNAGIPVWPRAKMLAYVCRKYKLVAVAGTHGKTTTSSILSSSLVRLGADPSFIIGGILDEFDNNARFGNGDYCVVEADESDGSFTFLDPYVAVITNIEEDHLDHYSGIEEIREAFAEFIKYIPEAGAAVVCANCEGLPELARNATKAKVIVYGTGDDCDVKVVPKDGGTFSIVLADGRSADTRMPYNPGIHNMLNAAGAVAALMHIGYSFEDSVEAVQSFGGVRRRFDLVGKAGGVTIIDDYGHHPTEISATLDAASKLGYKRIHVLFQPHRYSRTASLAEEFGPAFDAVDRVTVMDVYSAGETPIPGVTGKTIVDSVLEHDPEKDISWMQNRSEIVDYLANWLEPGDLLITMGAGDVTAMGPQVLSALEGRGN
ncbi:MAG: UDP-N-acetylmuramate--L-alanine ligase [Coriobacteriales bacterium]|jgi:UDP-N-acetylmuramate--alanine ligase